MIRRLIASMLAALALMVVCTSCDDLTRVEPDGWQKNRFENQVSNAVRDAVNAPGIDNGSTLVVTMSGDTLIAPADSALRATPRRTVYVSIQSPEYPNAISSRALSVIAVSSIAGAVVLILLVVLIGVLVTVWRRQSGRNNVINNAISHGYTLQESFYTQTPASAPVNITQVFTAGGEGDGDSTGQCPPVGASAMENATEAARTAVNATTRTSVPEKVRQIRNASILIGLGVILFISFTSAHEAPVGLFSGGILVVVGASKLLGVFLSNRI